MRHVPPAQGDIGYRLPCSGIERGRRLVCEDHGSFMGAKGVRNRFRICFAAILGQGADCVDSRMAVAWLSIPKTMHIQTAPMQLMMPSLMWSMLTITLLRASPEMKDILRSRRSCLSGGVSQSQELDSYCMMAQVVL